MHLATLHLAPILGAEKSKVPFYVAGGVLVAWAVIVSLGLGLRRPEFPGSKQGQRAVIAISAALVLAAVATAVISSGTSTKAQAAAAPASAAGTTTEAAAAPANTASTKTEAPAAPANTASTKAAAPAAPANTASTKAAAPAAAGGSSSRLALAANPGGQLSYDTKQLSAKAGTVTITLTNMAPVEHNAAIAQGSTVLGSTPTFTGGQKSFTLSLKPGTYTFFCSVPGHRQAGMEGTLSVT
jgi:plastocyanin